MIHTVNGGNVRRVGEVEMVVIEREAEANRHNRSWTGICSHVGTCMSVLVKVWLPFLIDETRFPAPTPDIRRVLWHSNTATLIRRTIPFTRPSLMSFYGARSYM